MPMKLYGFWRSLATYRVRAALASHLTVLLDVVLGSGDPALEWCPPLKCFVGYDGARASHVRKLVPALSDPLGSTWRWETLLTYHLTRQRNFEN